MITLVWGIHLICQSFKVYELHLISWRDDTDVDSNATLEPVYVEDSQVSASENDDGHISVNHFQTFNQRTGTQDTSTEDVPFDRGSEGVNEGKDAVTNKLNEDANPKEWFPYDGFDVDDSHNDLFITMMRVLVFIISPK
ncbi:hypothetical protein Tco_0201810 [Tanacetum coccineum]